MTEEIKNFQFPADNHIKEKKKEFGDLVDLNTSNCKYIFFPISKDIIIMYNLVQYKLKFIFI